MDQLDLDALADHHLELAHGARARRSSRALVGDKDSRLRHHLVALVAGEELAEHESPGEATLLILRGRVRLVAGEDGVELGRGALAEIPPMRHSVEALEDAVFLLTVARPRPDRGD
ncbi:MAG: cupin domain-containing protein [Actinomycetaceae bacterium]